MDATVSNPYVAPLHSTGYKYDVTVGTTYMCASSSPETKTPVAGSISPSPVSTEKVYGGTPLIPKNCKEVPPASEVTSGKTLSGNPEVLVSTGSSSGKQPKSKLLAITKHRYANRSRRSAKSGFEVRGPM